MAKASPGEKRQEERLIQELRDFQRSNPSNKRCFDCNEMMPQYVCLDFNTFVCTACSGIHREFAHRVKSISMSKFTESEVKNMINHGGNEAAQKYWRSKHDPSFRPNGGSDGERTRNFIRLTYIDRKWVYESPRHAKDDEPERTSSKSSKKKEKKADSDDDFFSSSSKPAKTTTENEFGDFSNFEGSSRTAAAAAQSFGDFSNFDNPAPTKKADNGFADFGDFEESSSTASTSQKATPRVTPPAPKFDSFKIAPPPGSSFSSTSANTTPSTNDLMGLSPPKKADDPFGLDTPASKTPSHPAPVASSPFDAFDAPTPTSRAGSRSNSAASLDPFSNMAPAAPSAPAPVQQSVSPFDAFGSPTAASPSSFDAFAAPSPASTPGSNVFDAFGGGGDAFGDFTGSNSSSRTNSVNAVLDPFASTSEKPVNAPVADPFAAFDGVQSSSGSAAPTADFGSSGGFQGGNNANNINHQQAAMNDPFGFASGTSNNGSVYPAGQQQQHPSGSVNQQFGGFPGGFPQQQQPQNAFGGQMQQQPMQPFHQGQPPHAQQQQWYGQQQGFPGQQQQPMHTTGHQYPGQFPPRPTGGAPPAPIPVKTPAPAASINDPFASLNLGNLGFGGSNSSTTTAARTGSGGAASSAPFAPASRSGASNSFGNASVSSGSFTHAQPQARATSSFTQSPQNAAFADPNAFGDFASAPAPTQTQASPANPFDLF